MINPADLSIDYSYSHRTYIEWVMGLPSPNNMMQRAREEAKDLWGERPILVIEPTFKNKTMPTWVHMVWATGPAKSENQDGSELVIIWWSEISPDTDRVLRSVDWEKHAQDFLI